MYWPPTINGSYTCHFYRYTLTDEGEFGVDSCEDVNSYLGVQVSHDKQTGCIELKQPFLITRIIEALGENNEFGKLS